MNDNIIDFTIQDISSHKLKTGKLALFDADKVKYVVPDRIYKRKLENEIKGVSDEFFNEPLVITITREWVEELTSKIDDPILFCFSDKSYNTYRSKVAFQKEYKGNRKIQKDYREYEGKDQDRIDCVKYIMENYNSILADNLEADDLVSFLQDDNTYIISNDKDLKQIPGWHYQNDINNIVKVENIDAIKHLCKQLIMGDTTDNIAGIPRFGEKKADEFINHPNFNPKTAFYMIINQYQVSENSLTKGLEAFCENFMLIKMKTDRGEFFKNKYRHVFDLKEFLINRIKEE